MWKNDLICAGKVPSVACVMQILVWHKGFGIFGKYMSGIRVGDSRTSEIGMKLEHQVEDQIIYAA